MKINSHQSIREALFQRILSGEWKPGTRIPGEVTLAEEYDCARTTVNRALQSLADDGLIIRKRKGGTHVCEKPVRRAKFEIPIIREQVEATGSIYHHNLILQKLKNPPSSIRSRLRLSPGNKALLLETIHLADGRPFAFEVRWVNTKAVPNIVDAPLTEISANEWLVKTVPFSSGDVMFSATNANQKIASALEAAENTAVFVIDRTTWLGEDFITTMKLYYQEGYQLYSRL